MRRVLVLVLAALLWAPAVVCAIGLGNIETRSGLNQPFNARIPLIHATADELDSLKVQLASPAQFERAGIDLTSSLLKLRFKVAQAGRGPDYIEITSHDPIREPFLNFLLEIDWPKGRLIREYTVLLDPPFYGASAKTAMRPATTTAAPSTSAAAPAPRPRAPAAPPVAAAPVPTAAPAVAAAPAATGGPVEAGDTLWSLADRMRPDQSISIQQMMLALLHANPEAFVQGNVNGLKKGYVLKMPERSDITSISREDALAEVRKQYAAWEQFREGMAKNVPAQPKGPVAQTESGAPEAAAGAAAPETSEAHLKLLSAKEGGAQAEAARQLAMAKETLESKKEENQDLKSQLVESEQIIDKLRSRIALQDDQLAELQAKLSGMQAKPAAPAPEEAKPAAPAEKPATPPPAEAPAAETQPAEAPAPETKPAEAAKPAPMEKPATPPAKPGAAPKPATTLKSILDQATDLVTKFVPKAVLETLPGGILTVLGAVAVVLLGLIVLLAKLVGRGRKERPMMVPPAPAVTPSLAEQEEEAEAPTEFGEAVTETREEEEPTIGAYEPGSTTQLEVTQIGGAQPSEPGAEGEEDPLAEVNVYLAYERFDEAEKVVKDAIERYPDEHKYKLRLLEVYYSSNNKSAYEEAAHSLHDAVGGSGPLWDSAVAMWREMSPDRELFAPREEERTITGMAAAPERQFVDITAGEEQPPEKMGDTVGEPPAATSDTGGGLDFDLGTGEETQSEDVLDLTAGGEAESMLDITAGETAGSEQILDLTRGEPGGEPPAAAPEEETTETPPPAPPDLEDTVDRFSQAKSEDLLDVTQSGDISAEEHKDLLNVTSPGTLTGETGAEEGVLDITGGHEEAPADNVIEFDLGGGLEAPPAESADEGVIDITAGSTGAEGAETGAPEADANMLEFDIGALETGETPAGAETSERETLNLSEQETLNLNEALPDSGTEPKSEEDQLSASLGAGEGLEIDLDDASLSSLSAPEEPAGDETMDLSSDDLSQSMEELSLDDLTKSLEDTLTGLQKSAESGEEEQPEESKDELSFDLSGGEELGDQGEHLSTIDMGETGGDQGEHLSTVEMGEETASTGAETGTEKTVVMPKQDAEMQSTADEVDTKLNLAKAYIELGDAAGARTILNEVVAEGSAAQQEEAQKLLQDMG